MMALIAELFLRSGARSNDGLLRRPGGSSAGHQ